MDGDTVLASLTVLYTRDTTCQELADTCHIFLRQEMCKNFQMKGHTNLRVCPVMEHMNMMNR